MYNSGSSPASVMGPSTIRCGFMSWSDITDEAVATFLCDLVDQGKAELTVRGYAQAAKQFTVWMSVKRKAGAGPLAGMDARDYGSEITTRRRPLTADELRWLVTIVETAGHMTVLTRDGEVSWSVSGPDRALLYRTAAETGLRTDELHSLTCKSFDLEADPPVVRLPGAATKNRQAAELPLRATTAALLRAHMEGEARTAAAFHMPPSHSTAKMIRSDLRLARARWLRAGGDRQERRERRRSSFLSVETDAGILNFHSLRTRTARC